MDEDDYLYIADRRTDMIISGGANIFPAEVEGALMAHPDVEAAVVIGLPHEDMGAVVHAVVKFSQASSHGPTPEALLRFLADRLASYKLPRSFDFVSEPLRDEAGKVRRQAIRDVRIGWLSNPEFKSKIRAV
jgi:bile acid-coenzyme A ligase